MSDSNLDWVMPIMRAGYAARGLVYVTVGGVAVWSAWAAGGSGQGTTTALATLRDAPFGQILLWVIAVGLWAYMVWRVLDALFDLEDYGDGAKGFFARAALIATGVIHGVLGASVASLAMGSGSGSGGGGGTQSLVAQLMSSPGGQWLVGLVGIATIGGGAYYGWKGIARTYKEDIVNTATSERLEPVLRAGFIAQGIVVGIIGILIAYAAITTDPSEAGGVGAALEQIRSAPFGRFLLIAIGLGVIGFAIENVIEAIYRTVPKLRDPDTQTMAMSARAKAKRAGSEASRQAREAMS